MIEIDGSTHSGSGTILRYSMALATLVRKPVHLTRVRERRDKPGLRPQHLQAVQACADLSGGRLEGANVGSRELVYHPGERMRHGDFHWDIGTAGSTTMLAFTLLPVALFAPGPCRFSVVGGLFQDFAPGAFHMQRVLIPLLRAMGADVRLDIARPGYVPQGQGRLVVEARPLKRPLSPMRMPAQGRVVRIRGISLASHLEDAGVSARMANESLKLMKQHGYSPRIEILNDTTAAQKGAALLLWAETDTGAILGADRAGKPGRRSEAIAAYVVKSLLEDLGAGATTDRHLADQLILFAALAGGATEYVIPQVTDHVKSNLWLVEKILGAEGRIERNRLKVEGTAFAPSAEL